jgi:hypothetical protein
MGVLQNIMVSSSKKKKFPVLFLFDLNGLRQQTQMDSVKI